MRTRTAANPRHHTNLRVCFGTCLLERIDLEGVSLGWRTARLRRRPGGCVLVLGCFRIHDLVCASLAIPLYNILASCEEKRVNSIIRQPCVHRMGAQSMSRQGATPCRSIKRKDRKVFLHIPPISINEEKALTRNFLGRRHLIRQLHWFSLLGPFFSLSPILRSSSPHQNIIRLKNPMVIRFLLYFRNRVGVTSNPTSRWVSAPDSMPRSRHAEPQYMLTQERSPIDGRAVRGLRRSGASNASGFKHPRAEGVCLTSPAAWSIHQNDLVSVRRRHV